MRVAFRCRIGTFRMLNDPLSGELHVRGGSSWRRGARWRDGRAKSRSLVPGAGPDDGSGKIAGGNARTSDATPASRKPGEGSGTGGGSETKRAPKKDEQVAEKIECDEKNLQPIEALPGSRFGLVKAINDGVQIVAVGRALLMDGDSRVRQRVFEQLVDLAYGKNSRAVEEEQPRKISWNLPRPERD